MATVNKSGSSSTENLMYSAVINRFIIVINQVYGTMVTFICEFHSGYAASNSSKGGRGLTKHGLTKPDVTKSSYLFRNNIRELGPPLNPVKIGFGWAF